MDTHHHDTNDLMTDVIGDHNWRNSPLPSPLNNSCFSLQWK